MQGEFYKENTVCPRSNVSSCLAKSISLMHYKAVDGNEGTGDGSVESNYNY